MRIRHTFQPARPTAKPAHERSHPGPSPAAECDDNERHPLHGFISRKSLELQLMHHFVTVTSLTFPSSSLHLGKNLWAVDAVRLAFQHDFLLNAIHAISALHLLRDLPDSPRFQNTPHNPSASITKPGIFIGATLATSSQLAKVHGFYLDLAVKQQREAVASITPENANALVFASILLSYQGLRLVPAEQLGLNPPQPYKLPVAWLRMGKGINDVSAVAGHIGCPESVIPYILRVSGEPNFQNKGAFFNAANRERFAHLLEFDTELNTVDHSEEAWEAYEKAVSYIGYMAKAIEDQSPPRILWRLVLGFAVLIPSSFIDYVEIGKPRALIILAHYFAMAKAVDEHWVFAGLARREVEGIHGLLPRTLQHYLDWPLRVLENPPIARVIS